LGSAFWGNAPASNTSATTLPPEPVADLTVLITAEWEAISQWKVSSNFYLHALSAKG